MSNKVEKYYESSYMDGSNPVDHESVYWVTGKELEVGELKCRLVEEFNNLAGEEVLDQLPELNLLSTVVAPDFETALCVKIKLSKEEAIDLLPDVVKSFCGHPVTDGVLRSLVPTLPVAEKGKFWNGEGVGLCARPRGGVRLSAQKGDTEVTLEDLEFCLILWVPVGPACYSCGSTRTKEFAPGKFTCQDCYCDF